MKSGVQAEATILEASVPKYQPNREIFVMTMDVPDFDTLTASSSLTPRGKSPSTFRTRGISSP